MPTVILACAILLAAAEPQAPPTAAPSIESLLPRIDRVLSKLRRRPLQSDRDTPWVIMHAVIGFGKDLELLDVEAGEKVNAVEYLLTRARHEGPRIFRDDDGEPALPTRNLSYGMTRSFVIQDHVDQFLAVFAEIGVALDRRIVAEGGRAFTVGDMLAASGRNFRSGQELAFTLVAMAAYGESWTTRHNETYRLEDALALALQRDPRRETEGGTHHLFGIAFALGKHRQQNGAVEGVWAEAQAYLRKYIDLTKAWQQENGAFSGDVFRRNVAPGGPRQLISTTGHALEWMSIAMPSDELHQPWVRRAMARLCTTLEEQPVERFSDGGLYHAAHALRLYRNAAP